MTVDIVEKSFIFYGTNDVIKVMKETKTGDKAGKKENSKYTLPVDNSVVTRHCTFWSRIAGEAYSPAEVYYLP